LVNYAGIDIKIKREEFLAAKALQHELEEDDPDDVGHLRGAEIGAAQPRKESLRIQTEVDPASLA
jgi:hypothetical protein